MSSKRTILLTVMGVALLAFLVDRFLLGEPAAAGAVEIDSPSDMSESLAEGTHQIEGSEEPLPADPALDWLARLDPAEETPRDVFVPSEMMKTYLSLQAETTPDEREDRENAKEDLAAKFVATYQLQGTSLSEDAMIAVINGRMVRIGDIIGGFQVVHIGSQHVVCVRQDLRVELRMERP